MASAANNSSKPFHTYENVCYDDHQHQPHHQQQQQQHIINNLASYETSLPLASAPTAPHPPPAAPAAFAAGTLMPQVLSNNQQAGCAQIVSKTATAATTTSASGILSNGFAQTTLASPGGGLPCGVAGATTTTAIAVNKTAIESPFPDPIADASAPKILSTSTVDSAGITTRMLTSSSSSSSLATGRSSRVNGLGNQSSNLVTRLITFPPQSSMDSLKEWSLSTLKCTKQLINERRGLCPITSDSRLANDIEQLRENRNKLVQMLKLGQLMINHYGQLVRTQKQLHSLVNEMSVRCFTGSSLAVQAATGGGNHNHHHHSTAYSNKGSKQVVANFSSLGNNLSSTTTSQSPTRSHHFHNNNNNNHHHHHNNNNNHNTSDHSIQNLEDYLPVLNHMKTFNDTNLVDDFKKNAITLNVAIRNGEKLITALNFYCSNLSTLINKTIEDTLTTVKQFELARLEYDAEKNSLNLMSIASSSSSPSSQTSATYSSDKVELARLRYEQLKEDVQIKMRFLEENTIKVMHKQLLLFNGAFASYTAGNTAALDSTLKQFSIRD